MPKIDLAPRQRRWTGLSPADRQQERRTLLLDAALEVLGSDGWTARLQIFPDPRPANGPASENPPRAAETPAPSAAHPVSTEMASSDAPSHRRCERAGGVADRQERVGWFVLTAGRLSGSIWE